MYIARRCATSAVFKSILELLLDIAGANNNGDNMKTSVLFAAVLCFLGKMALISDSFAFIILVVTLWHFALLLLVQFLAAHRSKARHIIVTANC